MTPSASRPLLLFSLIGAGLAASIACAQPSPPSEPPGPHAQPLPTPDFIIAVAQADEFELVEGRLAESHAWSRKVRNAAAEMVRDEALGEEHLRGAVMQAGLPAPRAPGLDIGQHQALQRLKTVSGPAFDREYVASQLRLDARLLDQIRAYRQHDGRGPLRRVSARMTAVVVRQPGYVPPPARRYRLT